MDINAISYLLMSYLIVQDGEIHSNELLTLREFHPSVDEWVTDQSSKIFSDSDNKITLEELAKQLFKQSEEDRERVIYLLIKVAIADKYYHPKEDNFIVRISDMINYDRKRLLVIIDSLKEELDEKYKEKIQSFYSTIKEDISSTLFKITGNEIFEGDLLEGKEFVNKIRKIAVKAHNDLELATVNMLHINSILQYSFQTLNISVKKIVNNGRKDKEVQSLIDYVKKLNENTQEAISKSIQENIELLDKKKHSIDYFTIAFMGRTKAGKSTFHNVITGEVTNDIGIGKLRTTRFNRVYNWENIRIVDTPGIGAPGGETDVETARNIVDEADLISYIITNDSIQETEFNFLSELKDKNKPIFIILNYKENLEQPAKLKKFLDKPLGWKENTGDKSIEGHVNRINEMISKNYDPNLVEIIPVHLLAAKLSKNLDGQFLDSQIKLLKKGSNINEYNKKIKQNIFRSGHLKKTLNVIDGCNHQLSLISKKTTLEIKEISKLLDDLITQKLRITGFLNNRRKVYRNKILAAIRNTHEDMTSQVHSFTTDYYDSQNIGKDWVKFIENKEYYKGLEYELKKISGDFEREISERLEEVLSDIRMNFKSFQVSSLSVDTKDYKFFARMTLGSLTLGLTMVTATNFWNPAGWITGAMAGGLFVLGIISELIFDSKEEKKKKAEYKISNQIKEAISKQTIKVETEVVNSFNNSCDELRKRVDKSFNILIDGAKDIQTLLYEINSISKSKELLMNKILVYRILEHLNYFKENSGLTNEIVENKLKEIEIFRNCENFEVKSKIKVSPSEHKQLIKALQLNIKFIN